MSGRVWPVKLVLSESDLDRLNDWLSRPSSMLNAADSFIIRATDTDVTSMLHNFNVRLWN